jgi:hypothetical protein
VEHIEVDVGEILEPCEYLAIAEGKTLEDAAAEFAIALRNMLTAIARYSHGSRISPTSTSMCSTSSVEVRSTNISTSLLPTVVV